LKEALVRKIKIVVILISLSASICFIILLARHNEAKRNEYARKFVGVSYRIQANAELSLVLLGVISEIWRNAIESGSDFESKIQMTLYAFKSYGVIDSLEYCNQKIEQGMRELKDYPRQYKEAYNVLMELFGVYSEIYSLSRYPSGSLLSFNTRVGDLSSKFTEIWSKLKVQMPEWK
jgi:hypothetical protein